MRIEREIIIPMLSKAKFAWMAEPITPEKYVYFEVMVEDLYGIKLWHVADAELGWKKVISHAEVVDEQKYITFLLKWS